VVVAHRDLKALVSVGAMPDAPFSDDAASALAGVLTKTERVGRMSTRGKKQRKQLRRETRIDVPGHHRGSSVHSPFD
jgi:hypothetical protein